MVNTASDKTSFTEINLADVQPKKVPKRLLYFSDGILEEYSSEDEVDNENQETQPLIDPKTLTWIPYFGYLVWWMGSRTLAVCDYLGENLAWFLGITSPKFQYELEQYEKMAKEEEELEKYMKAENAGWCSTGGEQDLTEAIAMQPQLRTPKDSLLKKDMELILPFERDELKSSSADGFGEKF